MEMLELVRQQIQMNRWKNQVGTQVTLDDDFIIPDTMSDADQMILSAGEIQLEPLKIQDGRVLVWESWIFTSYTGEKRAECRRSAVRFHLKSRSMSRM